MRGLRLVAGIGMLAGLLLAALAVRPALAVSPALVISEVYAPLGSTPSQQWVELYNMRPTAADVYPLDGLQLGTSTLRATLQTTQTLAGNSYMLVVFNPATLPTSPNRVVAALPDGLDPQQDMVALYSPGGVLMDAVNWGAPVAAWPNFSAALWNPGLAPIASPAGRLAGQSWGRTFPPGAPRDTDTSDDWTVHQDLSPGGVIPRPAATSGVFLNDFTNGAGVLSGILLWAAFIIVGIIAWRFERLRETRTYWWALMLAPSGILFYTYVVAQAFGSKRAALTDDEKWLSFPILAASAVACLVAVIIFQNVARSLLGGEDA